MPSVSKRLLILKYVAQQSVVSAHDVESHLNGIISASSARVSMYQMGLGRMNYGKVRHGIWFLRKQSHLDKLLAHYPDMYWASLNIPPMPLVPHALELNRIRNSFDNSSNMSVCKWVSEASLKGLPTNQRDGFDISNIPDAVFWRRKQDATQQKYFLEYERTLKNAARYKDIFTNYMRRDDTGNKNVIYICKDQFIKNNLLRIEEKLAQSGYLDAVGKYFQFVTLEGFYKTCGYPHPQEEERENEKIKTNC